MKVLSLFDGISCGRVALERAGVPVEKYVAYEIEPSAIRISERNYPDIIHKGDVQNATYTEGEYDLLIGGSPCQCLSSSNVWLKDGQYGVTGTGSSRLFWEYVRALLTIKPKYFFFENVASMKNVDRDIITQQLGVKPVKINSELFSAQKRNRYYWTNINFTVPTERTTNVVTQDLLEKDVPDKYFLRQGTLNCIMTPAKRGWISHKMEIDLPISRPITASCWRTHRADTDNYVTENRTPDGRTNVRHLTPLECERLQTLPDNYTSGEKDKERYQAIGNGWTVDVVAHVFRGLNEKPVGSDQVTFDDLIKDGWIE